MTYPCRNCDYSLSQMLLALIYPIIVGLNRIETASLLRSNEAFQHLTGLPSFPDPQTLRRFLLNALFLSESSYTVLMIDRCTNCGSNYRVSGKFERKVRTSRRI